MRGMPFYLASASPRRRDLLRQIGIDPVTLPASIDESPHSGETPGDLVRRLARAKARSVSPQLASRQPGVLLAADTVVTIDGVCLPKPSGPEAAHRTLRRLRARTHEVLTGVFISRTDDGRCVTDLDRTRVRFRAYDDRTIEAYVACGEGADKAGSYGIQGKGVLLVEKIEGSWSNVVGLPLERLQDWLAAVGVELWDLAGVRR